MEAAPPATRDKFSAALSVALNIATNSRTSKRRDAQAKIFGVWNTFCEKHGCHVTLGDVRGHDAKLAHLLVFGLQYRMFGQKNKSVRAGTVKEALQAVGQGISNLGTADPRLEAGTGKVHPLLEAFLKGMADEDDPAKRSYPVNITILRQLFDVDVLDREHPKDGVLNSHVCDLIVVGFYWLLRPSECVLGSKEARSQAFEFQHIHFTINNRLYSAPSAPLYDENDLARITFATLEFSDQKNAVRGEQVGHKPNSDPDLCPVKALGRIALRLKRAGAKPNTPIHRHYNPNPLYKGWYDTKPQYVTNALRHAAASVETQTGIAPHLLSARSLRPGGATALLCANIDSDAICLLGRWKSDAMLRYLRIQAATYSHNYAQRMLDHGAYTFHPQSYKDGLPPQEIPASVAQLLTHDELYDD